VSSADHSIITRRPCDQIERVNSSPEVPMAQLPWRNTDTIESSCFHWACFAAQVCSAVAIGLGSRPSLRGWPSLEA
jgi:hypothetical protein